MLAPVDLTDEEVDVICDPLIQNAAKCKHLERMKLNVRRKPNGRPLVNRQHYNVMTGCQPTTTTTEPNWG